MERNKINNQGQVSIYVIVALAIIAIIIGYFVYTNFISIDLGNGKFGEVYQYYDTCIQNNLKEAVDLAGTQGGRIYLSEFIPGSEYAPFSSQFNFMGFGVPYWYYIAGDGISKEQVPTKSQLEKEISKYLNEQLAKCDFSSFVEQGYNINLGEVSSSVSLGESEVKATVNSQLSVEKNNESAAVSSRSISLASNLGLLFDEALKIYSREKSDAFLENYSVDVLKLYAPVDGVLLQCAPQVWKTEDIKNELAQGLEANIAALKFKSKSGNYFDVGFDSKVNARAMYSSKWPQVLEIIGDGAGNGALVAKPEGNDAGLGVMGFCYVPYHFIYTLRFPVLIQLTAGDEVFQFPVVSVIDKNLPRQGVYSDLAGLTDENFDFCQYKTQDVTVKTYDSSLSPIDAKVKYSCFEQECDLGSSVNGVLETKAPACVNGLLIASKEGYDDSSIQFSSNDNELGELIMDRLYNISLVITSEGKVISGNALINFEGKRSASAFVPGNNEIQLSEGYYNVSVYVYGNSSITIPSSKSTQCVNVNSGGFLGLFGSTEEKCFDVELPETKIESALLGGGRSDAYLLPVQLEKGSLTIEVGKLKTPASLEELQNTFSIFDNQKLEVVL